MSRYFDESKQDVRIDTLLRDLLIGAVALIVLVMGGCPHYNVWRQGLVGKAALSRAQQDRQIAVQEAQAKRDSAMMYAEAEIERAKGVAEANRIIGESLHKNQDYLRYLWVTEVAGKDVDKTVVYVPTEANVPILEAGRATPAVR